jgi:hypothetical protein
MSVQLEFDGGGSATLVRVEGERFAIVADRAAAPGTPLRARIAGETLELKVSRCVRREDGSFAMDGRLVNLTRTLRRVLSARLGEG